MNYPTCFVNDEPGLKGVSMCEAPTYMATNSQRKGRPPFYGQLCETEECHRKAIFAQPDTKVARMCRLHKDSAMINLNAKCDVASCFKYASWGVPGRRVTRCRAHADGNMCDRKKKCTMCTKIATFGFPGSKPLWCKCHAPPATANIVNSRCCVDTCSKFAIRGAMCRKHYNLNYNKI